MTKVIRHPASGGKSTRKAKKTDKPVRVYEISIELLNSPIKINRVITVPSDVRLDVFGSVIQRAMGWGGGHLDSFTKNGVEYTDAETAAGSYNYGGSVDYKKVKLNELLTRRGSTIVYEYDFGDDWKLNRASCGPRGHMKPGVVLSAFNIMGILPCFDRLYS